MKICVFGAASAHIDDKYIKVVEDLGEKMAARGHSLVFGAGASGLMGAVARGVKRGGGKIHGIVPEFFRDEGVEQLYDACDEMTYTGTMAERKFLMEEDADAFLIVPGGVGTFEEFFEVLTLKQLGRHEKAIVIYNFDNFYNDLESFMVSVTDKKFITFKCYELYRYFASADECLDFLESYEPSHTPWQQLKIGE